jgi:SEC-C motif-containing protein
MGKMTLRNCVCGSNRQFAQCCQPLLDDIRSATTPEELMRSRYSAYALGGYGKYLLSTWFAPMATDLSIAELSRSDIDWIKLHIIDTGVDGNSGWVEFKASYQDNNHITEMHEKSVFIRQGSLWFYIGGEVSHNTQ